MVRFPLTPSLALLLCLLVFTCAWNYHTTREDLTRFVVNRRESIAHLAGIGLREKFDRLTDLGVSLSTRVRFRQLVEQKQWVEASRIMEEVPVQFPFIERVFLADTEGTLRADAPFVPDVRGENFAHRDWYQGVSRAWTPYISGLYRRQAEPRYNVIAVAAPIRAADQSVAGILVLQVKADTLVDWARQIDVGRDGFVYFLDPGGRVVGHPRFPPQGEIGNFSGEPFAQKLLQGNHGSEVLAPPGEEEPCLLAYQPLPGYGWGAVVHQPARTAFAMRDGNLRFLVTIYAVIFFFGLVVAAAARHTYLEHLRGQANLRRGYAHLEKRVQERTEELALANTHLERLSLLDPLTELLNRRGLEQSLVQEMARARREGSALAALILDLDDFKQVNETLGYRVGDVALQEIAGRLKSHLRATDHAARIGGDEFLVLLPETRPAEGVRAAEKLRLAISESFISLPSGEVRIAASIGLVTVLPGTSSLDHLIEQAHRALQKSKASGKNRVTFLRGTSGGPKPAASSLGPVVEALDRPSSYYVVRQPIFHLEDESPVGAELLSRSRVPSFQSPDDFFRLCTESNLLLKVDHLCLKLCLQASLHLPSGFRCHLNLFPSTLVSLPLPELLGTLDGGRLLGGYCVEISEQQIIGNPSYLAEPVKALKRAGIEVAIDDVGFGRSCLESLVLLEPDVVKIDKRFVLGIARDGRRVQSLKRLLRVAGSLGAEVIAEGIECREDLECLKGLEVPLGQGFLWGQPTPVLAGSFSASAKN